MFVGKDECRRTPSKEGRRIPLEKNEEIWLSGAMKRRPRKPAAGEIRILSRLFVLLFLLFPSVATPAGEESASDIVLRAFHYMRGETSAATVEMTIHRPDWERTMTILGWTRGERDSIFWITAPPKDKGNGTLKRGGEMWMFNPKINRVVKIPPSMMSQSWMGSDFSNNDLARTDSILRDYDHFLEGVRTEGGKKVYAIRSVPRPGAPVVWGMERLEIREDGIFLMEAFYDQDGKPVKVLRTEKIEPVGGRLFPVLWTISKADRKDEYTAIRYRSLVFDEAVPEGFFTLSSLRNPPGE